MHLSLIHKKQLSTSINESKAKPNENYDEARVISKPDIGPTSNPKALAANMK